MNLNNIYAVLRICAVYIVTTCRYLFQVPFLRDTTRMYTTTHFTLAVIYKPVCVRCKYTQYTRHVEYTMIFILTKGLCYLVDSTFPVILENAMYQTNRTISGVNTVPYNVVTVYFFFVDVRMAHTSLLLQYTT